MFNRPTFGGHIINTEGFFCTNVYHTYVMADFFCIFVHCNQAI